jgi:hypothetical protein
MPGYPPLVVSLVWLPVVKSDGRGSKEPVIMMRGLEQYPTDIQQMMDASLTALVKAHIAACTLQKVGT